MSLRYDCAVASERAAGLTAAQETLRRGMLVVLPTDTVYGIAADAFNATAVRALLNAKGRGGEMPPPVLIPDARTLDGLAASVPPPVRDLIDAFWPGALTVICEAQPSLEWDLGDNRGTVAVRMPLHPVALELLVVTGPLAVSSANISGRPAATTCEQARDQLGDMVSVYLDGGRSGAGQEDDDAERLPSTIVDATGPTLRIARHGAISRESLRAVVPLGWEDDPPPPADGDGDSAGAGEGAA